MGNKGSPPTSTVLGELGLKMLSALPHLNLKGGHCMCSQPVTRIIKLHDFLWCAWMVDICVPFKNWSWCLSLMCVVAS